MNDDNMTTSLEGDQPGSNSNSNRAYYNFINSIKSLETRKIYEFIIKKYMQFHNLQTIDELLSLAAINKDNPVVVIEDRIIDWLVSLRGTITYGTRCTYLAALTTFYEINDINIRKKRIARFLGQESTRKYKDRAYTTEEIRKILDFADIRSKALVLLLASSGIRIGAVSELKIRHLKKIPDYNLYKISWSPLGR
jgi:integrase